MFSLPAKVTSLTVATRSSHITPVSVEVEDVLNNNRQSIPLTQG